MSSVKRQRIQLFEAGNTRCPICLVEFTREGVESGRQATLEHVPPKGIASELGTRSVAMCLTCRECNESAGRGVDQAAIRAVRPVKGRAEIEGLLHTVLLSDKNRISIRARLPEPVSSELPEFMRPGGKLVVRFTFPSPRYADISYLRTAYLTVFSLLGKGGYPFAETPALQPVREQILRPKEEIVSGYARGVEMPGLKDGAFMICEPVTCWGVKMGACFVALPTGDRAPFYGKTGPIGLGTQVQLPGPLWFPAKFKAVPASIITLSEELTDKQRELWQFHARGQMEVNGKPRGIVLALRTGRQLVVLHTRNLR